MYRTLRLSIIFAAGLALVAWGGCRLPSAGRPASAVTVAAAVTSTPAAMPSASATASATSTRPPTPTATPTVTPTPTLTPTPSPTPPPAQRFSDALRYQTNGQYAQAADALRSLLNDPTSAALYGDALYRLAQVQAGAGDWPAAEQSLTDFLVRFPGHAHRDHALFLLGNVQEKLGKLPQAAAAVEQYASRHPEVRSYVQKRLGDLYRAMQDTDRAVSAYRQAAAEAPSATLQVQYQEEAASTLLMAEDYAGAVGEYDRILQTARLADYRCKVQYLAGMAYLSAGQSEAAITRFRRAIAESERSPYAHSALAQLVDLNAPVDDYLRGVIDYNNQAYWPAIAALDRYLQGQAPARADAAQNYLAASYAALNQIELAAAAYQKLLDAYPNSSYVGDAWLALARLRARAGDIEGARQLYLTFAQTYPDHVLAPRALLARGRLAEDAGDLRQAADDYLALAERYPQGVWSDAARQRAGLCLYRLGQYRDAAATWETQAGATASEDTRIEALFWAGKSRMAQGDVDRAVEHLTCVSSARPLSYYGGRAAKLARSISAGDAPTATPAPAASQDAEAWLLSWAGVSTEALRSAIPAELSANPRLLRGRELSELGLTKEAADEFDALRAEYANQPAHLYHLALIFQAWGEARQVIGAASRLLALSGAALEATPAELRRLAYPTRYFNDLVEAEAAARNIDPLLIYSVIRQESLFQSRAVSSAAAQGLMQIIPDTGRWIATRLAWPNFTVPDLYLPYINVKFGTYYLQQQLAAFGGDVISALAAYNAGPGNAAAWRKKAGQDDADLVFALVDLEETRAYLQAITQNLAIYRITYPAR
jgi:soluble lytic murein transglycosylase